MNNTTNRIYCSTGTMVGRINGYNYKIFTENAKDITADGFELMMVHAYYAQLRALSSEIERVGAVIEVIHAEKDIGGFLSRNDPVMIRKALADFEINCSFGAFLGAKKLVFHLWSAPDSDLYFENNLSHLSYLYELADKHSIRLLIENVPCVKSDPFSRFLEIEKTFPRAEFIFDTRFGAFHEQTDLFLDSEWIKNKKIDHMHFSDFIGPAHSFKALRPIPHLGFGTVGFDEIMPKIAERYHSSITLESPEIHSDRTCVDKINADIDYIRKNVKRNK